MHIILTTEKSAPKVHLSQNYIALRLAPEDILDITGFLYHVTSQLLAIQNSKTLFYSLPQSILS